MPTHVVRPDGRGDFATISAALDAAAPGDLVRVAAGTYREAVTVDVDDVTLRADGPVTVTNDGSFGMRIDGDGVTVEGFTVTGILGWTFPADHAATGFVVSGRDVRLVDNVAHGNGMNGFLVTATAQDVTISGGAAWNNSQAGVALGGGRSVTVEGLDLHNTGDGTGADGTFQRYGILSDNVGDTRLDNGAIRDVDGIAPIDGLVMRDLLVRDHLSYGIRIAAFDEATSPLPSGRIATRDLVLEDSRILRNGSDTDDWVGGLYHLGGVLIQHIRGGRVEGNLFQDNYHWGLDAYASDDVTYVDNWFIGNDLGAATPGVTFEPVSLEINGGAGNVVRNNLITGSTAGLFSSYIPDSGDGFDGNASITIADNILFGNEEVDLELLGENDVFSRTITNNIVGHIPDWHLGYIVEDLEPDFLSDNLYGVDPLFVDAAGGDYTLAPGSPAAAAGIGPTAPPPDGGVPGAGPGNDTLAGGAGADVLDGEAGDDMIAGRGGDDRLSGGEGEDLLRGEAGADTVRGGPGGDTLLGGPGEDRLVGGAGDDAAAGGGGADRLAGGAGDDSLAGGAGADVLDGEAGDDTIAGRGGDDRLSGGEGEDLLRGEAGADTVRGGPGGDTLLGGPGEDRLVGGAGDDAAAGGGGADRLAGGAGDDSLAGGAGDDRLAGGTGDDSLAGGAGGDRLAGGAGDDSLAGGAGGDRLAGGAGDDSLAGGAGGDRLSGGRDDDSVLGGTDDDRLAGGAGDDTPDGGSGGDRLTSHAGADRLLGGPGRDVLAAGSGSDTLDGGAGGDRLVGGAGADVFVWRPDGGRDVIRDFDPALDVIDLAGGLERAEVRVRPGDDGTFTVLLANGTALRLVGVLVDPDADIFV